MDATMTDTNHSVKSPLSPLLVTFVTFCILPDDDQITVADTGWSEETRERMRQAGYDDMDMIRAWYS